MGLNVPLAVRLWTYQPGTSPPPTQQYADRHITRELRDLTFRSSVPGGFQSASFSLNRPVADPGMDLAPYNGVVVYDTRSAQVVWEGVIEDLGPGVGSDGETWKVSAAGTAAHAGDQTQPLVYIDRRFDSWEPVTPTVSGWTVGTEIRESDDLEGLVFRWPRGAGLPDGTVNPQYCAVQYRDILVAGQKIAYIGSYYDCGLTDASGDHVFQCLVRTGLGTWGVAETRNFTTTPTSTWAVTIGTDWTAPHDTARLRAAWLGASGPTTVSDLNWVRLTDLFIRCTVFNADLSEDVGPYGNDWVVPRQIVADLLGRMLHRYDGANATLSSSSFQINHLAYPDGVTASQVLDDIMLFMPDHYWAAWETNPLTGLYKFEWTPWPTTVGYETDALDGYDASSASLELYNKVVVRYKDYLGRTKTIRRTQTIAELTRAGVSRTPQPIDLADELAGSSNAIRVGDQFLNEHKTPPNAGTLTVARPIIDLANGRMVQPWEIRPGRLIRVRGLVPRPDALNRTTRDAVTVFKVTGVEYNAASNTASLELDSAPRTVAQLLARMEQRRLRKH